MAENEYHKGKAPLNSVEGFIRQILGWREYIRGIYWTFMPKYLEMNFLGATRSLPDSFWGKPTKMFCIEEVVNQTKEHAYSHHIQRLMITGNFALLTGINPVEVHKWYLAVYADAYEWVEVPNTMGMALFSDGGIVASKPYAASGKYINRMSDFCKKCKYDPEKLIGDDACPFNSLYWNFFMQHKEQFKSNRRLAYVFSTLNRFDEEKKDAISEAAKNILNKIDLNVI
jgi:deoxyribodipyrimidine photolyase-related protein